MEQEEMSFWDHLEELRWTLFRSILALFIFAIGSFAFMRGSNGLTASYWLPAILILSFTDGCVI